MRAAQKTPAPQTLETLEGAESLAESLLAGMRHNFLTHGHLTPIAVVLAQRHPETLDKLPHVQPMIVGFEGEFNDQGKDGFAMHLKTFALTTDAVGVLFGSEAWSLSVEASKVGSLAEAREALGDFNGRLEKHPQRREVLHLIFEHKALGSKAWVAEIRREKGSTEVGDFESPSGWVPAEMSTGRFTNFLPS